jgi:hypothetical protein
MRAGSRRRPAAKHLRLAATARQNDPICAVHQSKGADSADAQIGGPARVISVGDRHLASHYRSAASPAGPARHGSNGSPCRAARPAEGQCQGPEPPRLHLRADSTSNTPPDGRPHPPDACYLFCMISRSGEISPVSVFKSLGHVKTHKSAFAGMRECHPRLASGSDRCSLSSRWAGLLYWFGCQWSLPMVTDSASRPPTRRVRSCGS